MNAPACGAGQQCAAGAADAAGNGQCVTERAEDRVRDVNREVPPGERPAHVVLVASRQHAPYHGNAYRTADLEGHGVDGRPDPRVALGDRPHHRVGRRGQQ